MRQEPQQFVETRITEAGCDQVHAGEIMVTAVLAGNRDRDRPCGKGGRATIFAILQDQHLMRQNAQLRSSHQVDFRVWFAAVDIISRDQKAQPISKAIALQNQIREPPSTAGSDPEG